MSATLPDRGMLTDQLVAYMQAAPLLSDNGIVFGDQVAPPAAGYHSGAEVGDDSGFVASVVLTTGVGLMGEAQETVRSAHTSWKLVYGLRSTGGSRQQADFAADRGRKALAEFPTGDVDLGEGWVVQKVLFTRLAAMREVRGTDVPTFALDDNIEVWVTRSAR